MGGGDAGTVKAIHKFLTELSTPDNIKVMIPNSKLFGNIIKNITAYDTRRIDLVFGSGAYDLRKLTSISVSHRARRVHREIKIDSS